MAHAVRHVAQHRRLEHADASVDVPGAVTAAPVDKLHHPPLLGDEIRTIRSRYPDERRRAARRTVGLHEPPERNARRHVGVDQQERLVELGAEPAQGTRRAQRLLGLRRDLHVKFQHGRRPPNLPGDALPISPTGIDPGPPDAGSLQAGEGPGQLRQIECRQERLGALGGQRVHAFPPAGSQHDADHGVFRPGRVGARAPRRHVRARGDAYRPLLVQGGECLRR